MKKYVLAAGAAMALATSASATPETRNSPTGGALPSGVTEIGGIVLDLKGLNNTRVVSQLAASSLFIGNAPGSNPLLIGTQTGFTSSILSQLGGGLLSASVRITLYDGDNQSGNFDFNDNTLALNGINFGNFSGVATQRTSSDGLSVISSGFGFGDDILGTGFFTNSNAASLALFFATLSGGSIAYQLNDTDPGDQYYDFTQGIDGSLINVGQGPNVTPGTGAVPESATWMMMIFGFGMAGAAMRYQRRSTKVTFA